ncbi:MAG TPA: hypothetical protein VMC42_07825 [Methanoregulaceae archaeon]|nr:hypothetical protein [Methanoregulaceae archaeon]
MKNQSAVVVASLMIIVLSFMFYLFSNQLNFFIIGIGLGLYIIATAVFFLISEIRDSIVEISDAFDMNSMIIDVSGQRGRTSTNGPTGPDEILNGEGPEKTDEKGPEY